MLLMRWCCWCNVAADALLLLMLLMRWCCWCCWCADAQMLLNQDQDLLADLSIAICSSLSGDIFVAHFQNCCRSLGWLTLTASLFFFPIKWKLWQSNVTRVFCFCRGKNTFLDIKWNAKFWQNMIQNWDCKCWLISGNNCKVGGGGLKLISFGLKICLTGNRNVKAMPSSKSQ